jgi:hypothetical protein
MILAICIWVGLSLPLGLVVGAFIRVGGSNE